MRREVKLLVGGGGWRSGDGEIRNPNTEIRRKSEIRDPNSLQDGARSVFFQGQKFVGRTATGQAAALPNRRHWLSDFGLRISFGFRVSGFGFQPAALLLCLLLPSCTEKPVSDLQCYPPAINLNGAQARQRVVVQASYADGVTCDVTREARCSIADERLARFTQGAVMPLADGKTKLQVTYNGRALTVPVTVTWAFSTR